MGDDSVNYPAVRHDVDLPARVFAPRHCPRSGRDLRAPVAALCRRSAGILEAPDPTATVVHIQVVSREQRHAGPTIDITALHVALTIHVLIVDNREREAGLIATTVHAVRPLHDAPAVIQPLPTARRGADVDFFPRRLTHVADVEIARLPVEREAPRIAESPGPCLGWIARIGNEWVVSR